MKRIIISSLTVLVLLLGSQQQASAWSKLRISVGLNISWEGSGNSFLFGLLKGAPAPEGYGDGTLPPGSPPPYSPGMTAGGFGAAQQPGPPQPGMAQPVSYSAYAPTNGNPAPSYGQGEPRAPSYWYER